MKRRERRYKKKSIRKTWRERLREWDITLLFGVPLIAWVKLPYLAGHTLVHFSLSGIIWGTGIISFAGFIAWAWYTGRVKEGGLGIYIFLGSLASGAIAILLCTLFLGTNCLIPRSKPYRRNAVVFEKVRTHGGRGHTSYHIGLRFTDCGEHFFWYGGYKAFNRLHSEDECIVILYKGLWGYEVIREVTKKR